LISIPAGLRRMPLGAFTVCTLVGSLVWNTVLVGAGYLLAEQWEMVLDYTEPLQTLVVAGREERLEARLRELAAGRESHVKVFGYVDNVRQLMAAADFLVTKAGGLTLGEALAAELPVICFGSLPGQEARNERFAAMAGVALVASSGAQLQRVIGAAVRDPVLLRNMRDRIRSYRRPQSAAEIVELVLNGHMTSRERAAG
jgi:processive 1,2-diacylglycerol beta-glucosyltransferase